MSKTEIRVIKKELRRFKAEIEKFEKRSKLIAVVHKCELCNRYYTQINVNKFNKVVNEMIEYIKTFCDNVETEKSGTIWLCNYNEFADDDSEYLKAEYNVCIHLVK